MYLYFIPHIPTSSPRKESKFRSPSRMAESWQAHIESLRNQIIEQRDLIKASDGRNWDHPGRWGSSRFSGTPPDQHCSMRLIFQASND